MRAVEVPIYDFSTHQRSREVRRVEPADVVIIEGILVLHMESIRQMLNMKIFVDTDDDLRLARRCNLCLLVCKHDSCPSGSSLRASSCCTLSAFARCKKMNIFVDTNNDLRRAWVRLRAQARHRI